MRRSSFARMKALAKQYARQAAEAPGEAARPEVDETSAVSAGDNLTPTAGRCDASGEWGAYGLLDLTTFGEGFRLS